MSIRLLLADGQRLLRTGFRTVLGAEPDLTVVAESGDGAEVLDLARRVSPDVLVLDLDLPRDGGVAVTRSIVAAGLPVRILVLTDRPGFGAGPAARGHFESDAPVPRADAGASAADFTTGAAALRAGAAGLLAKNLPGPELAAAIRAVAAGQAVLAPSALLQFLEPADRADPAAAIEGRPRRSQERRGDPRLAGLTEREREVLELVARGLTNAEIAAALSVGETTVKTHVGRLLTKLALRDRVAAAVLAYDVGLIRPSPPP